MSSQYPYDVDLLRDGAGAGDESFVCLLEIGAVAIAPSGYVLMIPMIWTRYNRIKPASTRELPTFTPAAMRLRPLATPAVLSLPRLHTVPPRHLINQTFREMVRESRHLLARMKSTSPRLERMALCLENHEASRGGILSLVSSFSSSFLEAFSGVLWARLWESTRRAMRQQKHPRLFQVPAQLPPPPVEAHWVALLQRRPLLKSLQHQLRLRLQRQLRLAQTLPHS